VEHDDAFAAGVPLVLKEVGEDQAAACLDDVGEELAAEALFLSRPPVGEIEEERVEAVKVDPLGIPAGVEVARLLLSPKLRVRRGLMCAVSCGNGSFRSEDVGRNCR
jgi:hypothetical protein